MVLEIKNKYFNDENYRCDIFVDEKEVKHNNMKERIDINYSKGEIVTIIFTNIMFEGKNILFIIFYWFLALISGCSERNPFGYPFNVLLKFQGKEDSLIYLESNSIWAAQPFKIEGTEVIHKNQFVSSSRIQVKWFMVTVLPFYFVLAFIYLAFWLTGILKGNVLLNGILLLFLSVASIVWTIHYIKILKICQNNPLKVNYFLPQDLQKTFHFSEYFLMFSSFHQCRISRQADQTFRSLSALLKSLIFEGI